MEDNLNELSVSYCAPAGRYAAMGDILRRCGRLLSLYVLCVCGALSFSNESTKPGRSHLLTGDWSEKFRVVWIVVLRGHRRKMVVFSRKYSLNNVNRSYNKQYGFIFTQYGFGSPKFPFYAH